MQVVPLTFKQAAAFVDRTHRHHEPPQGHRFSIGAMHDGRLVGVAIVGRPVARKTDQYRVSEITRLATDGTPNACSFLYGACARIATAMGFWTIQTFILDSEPGTSLRAAGYHFRNRSIGGDWNVPTRGGRRTDQPMEAKQRWSKILNPHHDLFGPLRP